MAKRSSSHRKKIEQTIEQAMSTIKKENFDEVFDSNEDKSIVDNIKQPEEHPRAKMDVAVTKSVQEFITEQSRGAETEQREESEKKQEPTFTKSIKNDSADIKPQELVKQDNEPGTDLIMLKHSLKELQEINFAGLTLPDIISCYTQEIEQLILEDGKQSLSFEEGVAVKWEETHPKRTYPALPEIHQIIDIISRRTALKKYQVFERLILNGLKYTKFVK